jgi:hypothetical protein
MASQKLQGERDNKLDDTRALIIFKHQITEAYAEATEQLTSIKYLGIDTIRQDPALTLELKVVIAVELGEAPENSKRN